MNLKSKIKISFIIVTVIPIIMMLCLFIYIGNTQLKNIEEKYGLEGIGIEGLTNQTRIYNKLTQEVYDELVVKIQNDADGIMETKYLESLDKELKEKYSFLIAKKEEDIIYNGCSADEEDIIQKLPDYKGEYHYPASYEGNSYIYGDYEYLIKQVTFKLSDDSTGSVYMVTRMNRVMPQLKYMLIEMLIAVTLVVLVTGIILAVWIHQSVMRPLNKLTVATKKIAEGDLNFTLERTGNDEFGDLCEDFENMRRRLKESAEERIHEDEENKEMISNISHDLKTPITAIRGYVEGIMDGVADTPEKMEKYIRTIYNKANDMDKLIGELTVYSKIDTNRIPYNFKKVNVDEYFADCAEEISVELEAKNIRLNYFNYVDKSTIIIADPEQLKRVINNIVSNSVKYIGNKQGALNIRINDENDFIHVEIEDNGKGISQRDLPYIFDRFYRTDASRNSNQGGSGIGLAIVKKIIEVHGGKIWATSKENTGTIMHFILRKYYEPEVVADYEQNIDN
ncbi:MAG: HAMP domain-containing histidine kinase [Lachnospiraceae bacterium]|nr:HAMP domain-containing histidine kinase [Lachnospiraceae bacterium]